jgi:hypothetical protein
MNKLTTILTLLGLLAVITPASYGASGTFSGRVWNDIDRDGIQDEGEPGMSNFPISIFSEKYAYYGYISNCFFATYYTDDDGYYNFAYSNANGSCTAPYFTNVNYNFIVQFGPPDIYGMSPYHAGTDDNIDSDFQMYPIIFVTNDSAVATIRDLGVFRWNTGMTFDMQANGVPIEMPLYVTNGTIVTFTYQIQNVGETRLSSVLIYNTALVEEQFFSLDCPVSIFPLEAASFATQLFVYASFTNYVVAAAVPIFGFCYPSPGYDPVFVLTQSVVVVVTNNPLDFSDGDIFPNAWEMEYGFDPLNSNAPNIHSDSDWMTNYEEYLAGTNPTNPASFFPNISVTDAPPDAVSMVVSTSTPDRVYNVWRSTNLLNDSQSWSLMPPEQTGTSGALVFTITNDLPGAHYRTGVRLP